MNEIQLDDAFPMPDTRELGRLRERFVAAASDAQLLDVAYRRVDSPFGSLLVAATPTGVVRIAFELEDHERVLAELAQSVSPRMLRDGRGTDDVARQLDEYFDRRRRVFDVDVDLQLAHGFRRDVLVHLRDIPYGHTESYAALARAAGRPAAVRAAASACANNPVPLVVPCHRVIRSDGSYGNYGGGPEMKVALLTMEAA
jgi:methylated-DNA-[protein]-cysteine S-methyltransferase